MKGKHANQAATRRDREDLVAEITTLKVTTQHAVADRDRIEEQATKRIAALEAEIVTLRAHLAEGTSPQVADLRAQAEQQRQAALDARDKVATWEKRLTKFRNVLVDLIAHNLHTTTADAWRIIGLAESVLAEPTEDKKINVPELPRYKSGGKGPATVSARAARRGRITVEQKRVIDKVRDPKDPRLAQILPAVGSDIDIEGSISIIDAALTDRNDG